MPSPVTATDTKGDSAILLTGASGFVGSAIAAALLKQSQQLICPSRRQLQSDQAALHYVQQQDWGRQADWSAHLQRVSAVIHCAARVHVMHDTAADPLAEFRAVNLDGSLNLARQAAAAGVRQFIFLSSVKVNGEATPVGRPFRETDPPKAADPYGISKLEAEQALLQLGRDSGMAVTIIRPPLIYGPGVKANFASMLHWVERGIPLPLGAIDNRRSLVYLGNLVSLVLHCLNHPAAAQQIFLVSDGADVSTSELLRAAAAAMHKPARLLPVPASWLRTAAGLLGKSAISDRLCGNLQVDISKARELLGWQPPFTLQQGLADTVAANPTSC